MHIQRPDSSAPSPEPVGPGRRETRPRSVQDLFDTALWAGSFDGLHRLSHDLSPSNLTPFSRSDGGPLPAGSASRVLEVAMSELGAAELPEVGLGEREALERVADVLARHGLDLTHPAAVAHLQPPTLALATAADTLASVVNASVDTFDSGPSAVAIERWVVQVLVKLAGLGPSADGVMTPGGSMSNLLGLLLARDAAASSRGIDVRRAGIAGIPNAVVLCSEMAHFSVNRSCAALGLGEDAVIRIASDRCRRMDANALLHTLESMDGHQVPVAIVATAGTTDFGSVDPLHEVAAIARARGIWLHVDAAYGFGALFSHRLAPRLEGVEQADSITLDLHKLGWQPAAASVLLVSDSDAFGAIDRHVEYLNPQDEADAGYTGLLGRSLQTTRRADALKVAATFLGLGRVGLGRLVDACHELARHAQALILDSPELELVSAAELTTVVFRYRPPAQEASRFDAADLNGLNVAIRRRLLEAGEAVVGRTKIDGPDGSCRVCLKFTFLNPRTRHGDVDALVDAVIRAGRACTRAPLELVEDPTEQPAKDRTSDPTEQPTEHTKGRA